MATGSTVRRKVDGIAGDVSKIRHDTKEAETERRCRQLESQLNGLKRELDDVRRAIEHANRR